MTHKRSLIGKQYLLWYVEYMKDGYFDQFGVSHWGHVVFEELVVTVFQEQTVPGPDLFTGASVTGIAAQAEDRRVFRCGWDMFDKPVFCRNKRVWRPDVESVRPHGAIREWHDAANLAAYRHFAFVSTDHKTPHNLSKLTICRTHGHSEFDEPCRFCEINAAQAEGMS